MKRKKQVKNQIKRELSKAFIDGGYYIAEQIYGKLKEIESVLKNQKEQKALVLVDSLIKQLYFYEKEENPIQIKKGTSNSI